MVPTARKTLLAVLEQSAECLLKNRRDETKHHPVPSQFEIPARGRNPRLQDVTLATSSSMVPKKKSLRTARSETTTKDKIEVVITGSEGSILAPNIWPLMSAITVGGNPASVLWGAKRSRKAQFQRLSPERKRGLGDAITESSRIKKGSRNGGNVL